MRPLDGLGCEEYGLAEFVGIDQLAISDLRDTRLAVETIQTFAGQLWSRREHEVDRHDRTGERQADPQRYSES